MDDNEIGIPETSEVKPPHPLKQPVAQRTAWLFIVLFVVITLVLVFYLKQLASPSVVLTTPTRDDSTLTKTPHVYTLEEMRGTASRPTSSQPAVVYTEEEMRGVTNTPPSPEATRVYSEEEMRGVTR